MMEFNKNLYSVSIIVVNYNSTMLLKDCLTSLQKFSKDISYEIIVIDNNSINDDIDSIANQYTNLTLIKNSQNVGFAAANNQGFEIANGKYILILNNDTIFVENTLKILFDYAETFKKEVFIGCKLLNPDGSHQISIVDFDSILNSFAENFFLYKLFPRSRHLNRFYLNYKNIVSQVEVDIIKGAFMFCSAGAIKRLNGFDPRFFFYAEETDICYRFKKSGGKIFYYPSTSIYHIGGATVEKYQWFKFKNQSIAKIQIYQKHFTGIKFALLIGMHYCGIFIRVFVYLALGAISLKSTLLAKSYYYFRQLFIYPKNLFKPTTK